MLYWQQSQKLFLKPNYLISQRKLKQTTVNHSTITTTAKKIQNYSVGAGFLLKK